MTQICSTVTGWIDEQVLEPVENWVSQSETKCNKWPWPLNWICKAVVFLVKVIVWVTKEVLKPVTTVVCNSISFVLGVVFWPFALLIDIVAQPIGVSWSATSWVFTTFLWGTHVKFLEKKDAPGGGFEYYFECTCPYGEFHTFSVLAADEATAGEDAKKICKNSC